METEKRIEYFDIAKGIAILLVIMGHTVKSRLINHFIFSFHMPIFFLISGYFFRKKTPEICIKQNIKRLIIPYIFTCLGVIFFNILFAILEGQTGTIPKSTLRYFFASLYGSGNDQNNPFFIPQIGAIWFLLAMFIALIIFNSIVDLKYYMVIVSVLAYIGYKTSQFLWLPFSVQSALVALVFIALGYESNKNNLLEKKISVWWLGGIFVIWLIAFIYGGQLYLVRCYFGNGLFDIVGSLCGSYIILKFSMLLEKVTYVNSLMKFLGKNTLPILCFHLIELNTFPWWTIQEIFAKNGYTHYGVFILLLKYIWMIFALLIVHKLSILRKLFAIK